MGYREPMFLITDAAGYPVGAVAVEDDRWVGRDTTGRQLFNRKDQAGASRAARPYGTLTSTAWYGIRATRPGQTRSTRILTDRRGLPYVTDPWPTYVTGCCAATVTITVDDGVLCSAPAIPLSTRAWPGIPTSTPPHAPDRPSWAAGLARLRWHSVQPLDNVRALRQREPPVDAGSGFRPVRRPRPVPAPRSSKTVRRNGACRDRTTVPGRLDQAAPARVHASRTTKPPGGPPAARHNDAQRPPLRRDNHVRAHHKPDQQP